MNTRKPMELHTGHYTDAEKETMRRENEAATTARDFLEGVPDGLINETAEQEWQRVTKELEGLSAIGNLDACNLIGYCNAFALYRKATEELAGQPLIMETEKGPQKNPLVAVQDLYAKQMRDFAVKAGLSIDTRLKYASLQVKDEDKDIDDTFGGI